MEMDMEEEKILTTYAFQIGQTKQPEITTTLTRNHLL